MPDFDSLADNISGEVGGRGGREADKPAAPMQPAPEEKALSDLQKVKWEECWGNNKPPVWDLADTAPWKEIEASVKPTASGNVDGSCHDKCNQANVEIQKKCQEVRKTIAAWLDQQGCPSLVKTYHKLQQDCGMPQSQNVSYCTAPGCGGCSNGMCTRG